MEKYEKDTEAKQQALNALKSSRAADQAALQELAKQVSREEGRRQQRRACQASGPRSCRRLFRHPPPPRGPASNIAGMGEDEPLSKAGGSLGGGLRFSPLKGS